LNINWVGIVVGLGPAMVELTFEQLFANFNFGEL
jgi:hypothetical protein